MKGLEQNEYIFSDWLDGKLTKAEINQLKKDGDLEALNQLKEDLDKLFVRPIKQEPTIPAYNQEEEFKELKKRLAPNKPYRLNVWLKIAASILLIISIYTYWISENRLGKFLEYNNQLAVTKKIQLLDGSTVYLGGLSKLKYEDKDNTRMVELNGSAFFEVVSDIKQFNIKTHLGEIKVLGTSFNIHSQENKLEVSCKTGKVLVTDYETRDSIHLTKQERLFITRQAQSVKDSIPDNFWELNFVKTPLRDILQQLEQLYTVEIKTIGIDGSEEFTVQGIKKYTSSPGEILNELCKMSGRIICDIDTKNNQFILKTDE